MSLKAVVLKVLEELRDSGRIPCLTGVKDGDDQDIELKHAGMDLMRGTVSTEGTCVGAVRLFERSGGSRVLILLPGLTSVAKTSYEEDRELFAIALLMCANGPTAKLMLAKGELAVALDLCLPPDCSEADIRLVLHEGLRRAITTRLEYEVRVWRKKAEDIIPDADDQARERLKLIPEMAGEDPLGDEVSDERL